MIRKDTIAPFSLKSSNREVVVVEEATAQERKDISFCGQKGSRKERHCQLFKLTILAILPGLILIVRNAINVVDNVKVWQHVFFS